MPIFIDLTTADGKKVRVNTSLVNLYGEVNEGNGRNTMLEIDGARLYVQEPMDLIDSKIARAIRSWAWEVKEGRESDPYLR